MRKGLPFFRIAAADAVLSDAEFAELELSSD